LYSSVNSFESLTPNGETWFQAGAWAFLEKRSQLKKTGVIVNGVALSVSSLDRRISAGFLKQTASDLAQ